MTPPETGDLFEPAAHEPTAPPADAPLAERMRPRALSEIRGQEALLAPDGSVRRALAARALPSMILWGPPGCGKTTLARALAAEGAASFEPFSAVLGGVAELRAVVDRARRRRRGGGSTLLFIDEIHRFHKGQQDALLPHVEDGTVTLIGATTENPSFTLTPALRSRCRVVRLEGLSPDDLVALLASALDDAERGLGALSLSAEPAALDAIAAAAEGDARVALSLLDQGARLLVADGATRLTTEALGALTERGPLQHDRSGDAHFDVVSAFIKSLRGSDPDAALYWAARMIEAGEDPRYVLRRLLIFASEDVGNADPRALQIALAAVQTYERLGMPEATHALAQAITYCATAPKSNAAYVAWGEAVADARRFGSAAVPLHLRNAPTALAAEQGHGAAYRYPHDHAGHFVDADYRPAPLQGRRYYRPSDQGYEQRIAERLRRWWGDQA